MSDKIRVAVIDDHPLMREGIIHVLSQEDDVEVIGRGASADEAVAIAQQLLPDIMLLDMNMPGTGLAALSRIGVSCPAVRTIALTVREDHDAVSGALMLGARAYVLKGVGSAELLDIIRTVHEGGSYVSPGLASKLIGDLERKRNGVAEREETLTAREEQILRLIGKGLSNKEIGNTLELAEKTIKHYVTNVLQKLHVRNRVEAALLAQNRAKSGSEAR